MWRNRDMVSVAARLDGREHEKQHEQGECQKAQGPAPAEA
jgi:hypothetical protein